MQITHLGHACVVVEREGRRVLVDPGSMSAVPEGLAVDAILVTHSHVDHVDVKAVGAAREANPDAVVVADAASAGVLADAGVEGVQIVESAEAVVVEVAGMSVAATTLAHAPIHCDLPELANNAYYLGETLLHPGDAFWAPGHPVEVLLLPIGGPWMKLSEAIDYVRLVSPRVAIPIHQGGLAPTHRALHSDLLRKLGPAGTEIVVLEEGRATSISS
jgi:L-ascorbate metabolism protein UlaG (beta-lactamase superfamily)